MNRNNYKYKLVAYIAERDYTLFSLIENKMALPKRTKKTRSGVPRIRRGDKLQSNGMVGKNGMKKFQIPEASRALL